MYTTYNYYRTEYNGKISDADTWKRIGKKADRLLDKITGNKLTFAFPTVASDADNVYQCECELIDFVYGVELATSVQGYEMQSDGTARGKVVKSVSSGSESVTYTGGDIYEKASSDATALYQSALGICKVWLSGVTDLNGINLLYAGFYPKVRE